MKDTHVKHVLWLTVATVFISTSGALGKFIDMPIPVIVWWRSALAAGFLFLFCKYKKINLKIHSSQDRMTFFISALFLGAHWITYFYALKLSNVAIGMLSLFTFPIITAVLEPFFSKVKFDPIHLVLGGLVLIGIYFLAPEFDLESSQLKGVLFGLLSALCYAIRTLMLKQHVASYNGSMLMFYQVLILAAVLIPSLFILGTSAIETQFPYVILLALLTTAIGHTMFINSLKYFKVSTASIIASTQPIFGIIIAFFFLNEIPTWNTYLGGALIISTVVIESMRSKRKNS
ncbi:DMT family transporter [Psychroserpens luteolus]|uniref:DMT family transporter n=1 Tax=Psychroserpens luteolus TaxID=2855840 RepID=UPI001E404EF5|nr:EamA family transporter [Psychroserpens luteolus]MCD2258507.1 DMT family transporter [Psychroserpens luteolus]